MYEILFKRSAIKALQKLQSNLQQRIFHEISALANNPRPIGCIQLHGDHNQYRIRCGDYRVIYEIQDAQLVIIVIKVGHRREIYK